MTEIHYWDCLVDILQTMQFQKSKTRTCTKETPVNQVHVLKNSIVRRKIDFENDNQENQEGKPLNGKKSRKKRKKINKQINETHKSDKDKEETLSKILGEDTTVTVEFFDDFEKARSQTQNCDIDKNNNSSSDDCSKSKPVKTSKKKSKSKTSQKNDKLDDEASRIETSQIKGPLRYPRISLREFSRLSAEEENVLNNENIFNGGSKQHVMNNHENFKEFPSNGGCLKKSITEILNSLNNVHFYSNTKNTNIENESIQTKDVLSCDSSARNVPHNYSFNKPKSYGTLENSAVTNPFKLTKDFSRLNLNDPDPKSNAEGTFGLHKPNISDLILSGTDLGDPNLGKIELNRPNLSNLELNDVAAGKQGESDREKGEYILGGSDFGQFDLNTSTDSNIINSMFRQNKTSNKPYLRKSHKSGLSSLILTGTDLSKRPSGLSAPNFPFDFKKSNSFCENLDFSTDHFCSKSDEETENSIKASCDNVPDILELLGTGDQSPIRRDNGDFEDNPVTFELLCTVRGVERLFNLLRKRRVRNAKPDAFIVEHIDFLVTVIKEKNNMTSTAYYGNSYLLFNMDLAMSTLENNTGLRLVAKDDN